eukprot:6114206-Pyramimonas_sp.AAC.1
MLLWPVRQLQCIPCASSAHDNDPTFPLAVRAPGQISQGALLVAVQTGRCMETPRCNRVNTRNTRGMSNLLCPASMA